jgi:hypothetical protein
MMFQTPPEKKTEPTLTVPLLSSNSTVIIRQVGGAEELLLESPPLRETGEAQEQWFVRSIVSLNSNKQITQEDTLQMLLGNRLYLTVKIIEFSYGDEVIFDSQCPGCGYVNENKMVSISRTVLPSATRYPDQLEYSYILPSGKKMIYGFNTGHHERAYMMNKDAGGVYLMYMRVKKIDGFDVVPEIVASTLDPLDRRALRAELTRHPGGGLNTSVAIKCTGCNKYYTKLLQEQISFFLPGLR